jgi:serine/threonine protein kinase
MLVGKSAKASRTDVDADIRLKVTDFGVARILDSEATRLTRTGDLVGTIDYMSPEQATGGVSDAGPSSDTYSLGAILYTLLTGRPPLVADDPVVALRMISEMEPLPVRVFAPQVPIDVETICAKCLEKSPERRYGAASDLADDLGAFLEGKPITARPIGTRLAKKAAETLDQVFKESPNDFYVLEINDLIQGYLRNRTAESLTR